MDSERCSESGRLKISRAFGITTGDLFGPVSTTVIKVRVREPNPLSKLSPDNLTTIKKALKLLNRTFTPS